MGCTRSKPIQFEAVMKNPTAEDIAKLERSLREAAVKRTGSEEVTLYRKPVYRKDVDSRDKIRTAFQKNTQVQVLFGSIDGNTLEDVINAFQVREAGQGQEVIKQADLTDCLYVVSSGSVDIYMVASVDGTEIMPEGRGSKVMSLGDGQLFGRWCQESKSAGTLGSKVTSMRAEALFGELAMAHIEPRSITAVVTSPTAKLWVLEGDDLKVVLLLGLHHMKDGGSGWLSKSKLLTFLDHPAIMQLVQLIETEEYKPGATIMQQGGPGDKFCILRSGTAAAFINGPAGEKQVMSYTEPGDYFGEVSILTALPRQATVRALESGCSVVSLPKSHFLPIFKPAIGFLKENMAKYERYGGLVDL